MMRSDPIHHRAWCCEPESEFAPEQLRERRRVIPCSCIFDEHPPPAAVLAGFLAVRRGRPPTAAPTRTSSLKFAKMSRHYALRHRLRMNGPPTRPLAMRQCPINTPSRFQAVASSTSEAPPPSASDTAPRGPNGNPRTARIPRCTTPHPPMHRLRRRRTFHRAQPPTPDCPGNPEHRQAPRSRDSLQIPKSARSGEPGPGDNTTQSKSPSSPGTRILVVAHHHRLPAHSRAPARETGCT